LPIHLPAFFSTIEKRPYPWMCQWPTSRRNLAHASSRDSGFPPMLYDQQIGKHARGGCEVIKMRQPEYQAGCFDHAFWIAKKDVSDQARPALGRDPLPLVLRPARLHS
jgi:hypothetical protein